MDKNLPFLLSGYVRTTCEFLIADRKCWEATKNGVLFFDLDIRDTDIKLHHFPSSSIVGVRWRYLLDCWNKYVLNSNSLIPAHKIKIYNESTNKCETKSLQTLTFFKNSSTENSLQVTTTESSNTSTCFKEVSKNETRTLLRKHDSNMNEWLPDFSIIESSISINKALNVPLIDTVGCNLFQKGDLTLTSTLAPKTQKHRDVIAQIEVKIVCEEDNLKKELKNLGLIFYKDQHNTNTTIQPYDNIIQTLHHIKVIRKSFNLKSTKYIQFFCNIVCKGVPAPLFLRHQPLDPACPLFKNLCFPLPHFYSIRF